MSAKHRKVQRGDSALYHGVCRECLRRGVLILPTRLCEFCLTRAADRPIGPSRQQVLDAIDEVPPEDD